ncbi:hypothetical protein DFH28DRAFT_878763 [Melampsora americana]|nr:hypothetical protein DFH28DRAFT_878763 [Melampsora americana]
MELAEATKRPRVSKCSLCLTPGHNITTCPLRQSQSSTSGGLVASTSSAIQRPVSDCSSSGHSVALDDEDVDRSDSDASSESDSDASDIDILGQLGPEEYDDDEQEHADDESEQGQEDKNLCPFCDEPLPATPSTKLVDLEATLLAMPNIRTRVGREGAMSLPFPQTAEFCHLHHAERETIPRGISRGWPTVIDFNGLEK